MDLNIPNSGSVRKRIASLFLGAKMFNVLPEDKQKLGPGKYSYKRRLFEVMV